MLARHRGVLHSRGPSVCAFRTAEVFAVSISSAEGLHFSAFIIILASYKYLSYLLLLPQSLSV